MAAIVSAVSAPTRGCTGLSLALGSATAAVNVPAPAVDEHAPTTADTREAAVLTGGYFWGVQGVFEHVRGVQRAVSGYAGGTEQTAHYDDVSTGTTGQAESAHNPAGIWRTAIGRMTTQRRQVLTAARAATAEGGTARRQQRCRSMPLGLP